MRCQTSSGLTDRLRALAGREERRSLYRVAGRADRRRHALEEAAAEQGQARLTGAGIRLPKCSMRRLGPPGGQRVSARQAGYRAHRVVAASSITQPWKSPGPAGRSTHAAVDVLDTRRLIRRRRHCSVSCTRRSCSLGHFTQAAWPQACREARSPASPSCAPSPMGKWAASS